MKPDVAQPQLAPTQVYEQELHILQYFGLPPPSIYVHKLQRTNCGAITGLDRILSLK